MKQRNAIILMITLIFSHTVMANTKLSEIFAPDMLQSDLAYLEQITGIAKSTDIYSGVKHYKVEGCDVEVSYSPDNKIIALGLKLTPNCSFDLAPFIGRSNVLPANQMTFEQFDGNYYASCLYMCGKAYDPLIYKHHEEPHANNFLEVLVSSVSADNYAWAEAMIKKEGEEWVIDTKFNCDPNKYDALAEQLFGKDKIEEITVGYGLIDHVKKFSNCKP